MGYSQIEPTEEEIKRHRETLKGIKGVYVLIEDLNPVAKKLGITEELLKTEVELKLRLAGIRIYSEEEMLEYLYPALYVNLNTHKDTGSGIGFYAFSLEIAIKEAAYIKRNNRPDHVTTWNDGVLGFFTKENSLELIREVLKRVLDRFLNDYLAVNPKK